MESDKHPDRIMREIRMEALPASGSTSDYQKAINEALVRVYEYPPCLSKPYIARALQRAGFVPVGKDKHGCMMLFNPTHKPRSGSDLVI